MTLPAELFADRDFMRLYRMALLGANDVYRSEVDNLIALAFIAGSSVGIREAVATMRGEHKAGGQQS